MVSATESKIIITVVTIVIVGLMVVSGMLKKLANFSYLELFCFKDYMQAVCLIRKQLLLHQLLQQQ
jgi:hypothetical protein